METKFCGHCDTSKPVEAFGRNKCRANGLSDWCKQCSREYGQDLKGLARGKLRGKQLQRKARQRGNEFNMAIDEFSEWFNSQEMRCHYCKREVFAYKDLPMNQRRLLGLTIDRKDNRQQYTIDNIAIACGRCNLMKGSWLTEEQMLDAAKRYFQQG